VVDLATQRILGPESGLPSLPSAQLGLLRRAGRSDATSALCEEVRASLAGIGPGLREAA
jgi:hypothetical protein